MPISEIDSHVSGTPHTTSDLKTPTHRVLSLPEGRPSGSRLTQTPSLPWRKGEEAVRAQYPTCPNQPKSLEPFHYAAYPQELGATKGILGLWGSYEPWGPRRSRPRTSKPSRSQDPSTRKPNGEGAATVTGTSVMPGITLSQTYQR